MGCCDAHTLAAQSPQHVVRVRRAKWVVVRCKAVDRVRSGQAGEVKVPSTEWVLSTLRMSTAPNCAGPAIPSSQHSAQGITQATYQTRSRAAGVLPSELGPCVYRLRLERSRSAACCVRRANGRPAVVRGAGRGGCPRDGGGPRVEGRGVSKGGGAASAEARG